MTSFQESRCDQNGYSICSVYPGDSKAINQEPFSSKEARQTHNTVDEFYIGHVISLVDLMTINRENLKKGTRMRERKRIANIF